MHPHLSRLLVAPGAVAVPREGGSGPAVRRLDDELLVEEAER
jgi:hypothetical protein